jgi:hypothetical protein
VNTLRTLLVLLLVVALPWSAGATMRENLHCHHDGLGALIGVTPQHDHAGMGHHGQNIDQGCDCEVKCHCQHHCASGTGIAGLGLVTPTLSFASNTGAATAPYAAWIPSIQDASPFRPPIAAPPGAA